MRIYFKYNRSSALYKMGLLRDLSGVALAKLEAKRSRGFTLVELLVVVSIATIMMTALVVQQGKWNDQLAVSTQAYELTLMLRQAQIYSLAVRENLGSTGDKFDIGYGVYFDDDEGEEDTGQYVFFADKNKNQKYDVGAGELIETKTFIRGVNISKFCGRNSGGQEKCSDQHDNLDKLNISFFRPEPKAVITFFKEGVNQFDKIYPPATIYLRSPQGKESSIKVEDNGQISVQ